MCASHLEKPRDYVDGTDILAGTFSNRPKDAAALQQP